MKATTLCCDLKKAAKIFLF